MAAAWVRSLSCKSTAVADAVADPPQPPKKPPLLPVSCAAANAVKNSVAFVPKQPPRAARPKPRPRTKHKKRAPQFMPSPAAAPPASSAFLTMTELPEGHSSRRVVELIFASGWTAGAAAAGAAATVEVLFRVHNAARTVARFEEARAGARARGAVARCAADGNEMMRFQCRPAASHGGAGEVFDAGVATCRLGPAEAAVRTFSGSGAAHASAGGGSGRRAMLVCRVIAGRVRPVNGPTPSTAEYDSVDMGDGELVVLDRRAVLPCFLIIYKV